MVLFQFQCVKCQLYQGLLLNPIPLDNLAHPVFRMDFCLYKDDEANLKFSLSIHLKVYPLQEFTLVSLKGIIPLKL